MNAGVGDKQAFPTPRQPAVGHQAFILTQIHHLTQVFKTTGERTRQACDQRIGLAVCQQAGSANVSIWLMLRLASRINMPRR